MTNFIEAYIENLNVEQIDNLISQGIDVNESIHGYTMLRYAAMYSSKVDVIEKLFDEKKKKFFW